jgi:hypothetical protein
LQHSAPVATLRHGCNTSRCGSDRSQGCAELRVPCRAVQVLNHKAGHAFIYVIVGDAPNATKYVAP